MTLSVIIFFICLAAYFVGLIIFVLIKRYRNKKAYNKELEARKNEEEAQDHDSNA